jgi:hypothetical protein
MPAATRGASNSVRCRRPHTVLINTRYASSNTRCQQPRALPNDRTRYRQAQIMPAATRGVHIDPISNSLGMLIWNLFYPLNCLSLPKDSILTLLNNSKVHIVYELSISLNMLAVAKHGNLPDIHAAMQYFMTPAKIQ